LVGDADLVRMLLVLMTAKDVAKEGLKEYFG
jgi:hypothetical protein